MGRHVVVDTPMVINAGGVTLHLITFQDLYEECSTNLALFDALIAPGANVEAVLASAGFVLPSACLASLINLLADTDGTGRVAFIRACMTTKDSWKNSKQKDILHVNAKAKATATSSLEDTPFCHWDDCPPQPE